MLIFVVKFIPFIVYLFLDGEQHQLKPADVLLKTEFIKCDIPTPFPVVNHVIQTNEESAKLYIKEISKWKTLDDKNDDGNNL